MLAWGERYCLKSGSFLFSNMSRIGKKPVNIPKGVAVKIAGPTVLVKGPKGELTREFSSLVDFRVEADRVFVTVKDSAAGTLWGLSRALLANMVKGVSAGFEETLEFSGVGFKAQARGQELELNLGFAKPVVIKAPAGVSFQVEKNLIKVMGLNKEDVGQVAARVRAARPPEPYKGSGIKYQDEVIIKKAGKKAVTGT